MSFGSGAMVNTSGATTIYYNPASNPFGSGFNTTSYTTGTDFTALVTGGGLLTAYMLVNTVADLQNIQNNLSGTYALGRDINAGATSGWNGGAGFNPIGSNYSNEFSGMLDGHGKSIINLTVNAATPGWTGLFGIIGLNGSVFNLNLSGAKIHGIGWSNNAQGAVGSIAGYNFGTIHDVSATGSVTGDSDYTGGIVGWNVGVLFNAQSYTSTTGTGSYVGGVAALNSGSILASTSSGAVVGNGTFDVGGIAGYNSGTITNSYSNADISGGAEFVGGIAGLNTGSISDVYDSRLVAGSLAGQIAGANSGTVASAYWDPHGAGQSISTTCTNGACQTIQSGYAIGFDQATSQNVIRIGDGTSFNSASSTSYAGFDFSTAGPWVIFEGQTRPLLRMEYSTTITNAHQLQLMALDTTANYTLATNIDLSATKSETDIWGSSGFVQVGDFTTGFTGSLSGNNFTISNLNIAVSDQAGLFRLIGQTGSVHDLTFSNATVSGGSNTGVLAGFNAGTIANVQVLTSVVHGGDFTGGLTGGNLGSITGSTFVAVTTSPSVSGNNLVGGLVGANYGAITSSVAAGAVSGVQNVGGLVGASNGTLTDVSAAVNVTGQTWVGGLVGSANGGSILRGNANGYTVSGTSATTSTLGVGGLVGLNQGAITDSHSNNTVSGGASGLDTGGLVGLNQGTIGSASRTVTASGTVSGGGGVGGLVGANSGSIAKASATGNVSGVNFVGGLAGINAGGTIDTVSASNTVTGTGVGTGGLVGLDQGTIGNF